MMFDKHNNISSNVILDFFEGYKMMHDIPIYYKAQFN